MNIRVITLPDDRSRFAAFAGRLPAGIAPVAFLAIDGWRQGFAKLYQHPCVRGPLLAYTPGHLGCALSHVKLWQWAAAKAVPTTIAEDDVVLRRDFEPCMDRVLGDLPAGWDLVYWGYAQQCHACVTFNAGTQSVVLSSSCDSSPAAIEAFVGNRQPPTWLRVVNAWSTACYTVSPAGAAKLLAAIVPIVNRLIPVHQLRERRINDAIDAEVSGVMSEINAYLCFPPIAFAPANGPTSQTNLDTREIRSRTKKGAS